MGNLVPHSHCPESPMNLRNLSKLGWFSLVLCIACLYILAFSLDIRPQSIPMIRRMITGVQTPKKGAKTILFWNTMFGDKSFYFGRGDVFESCRIKNCYATYDRSMMNVWDFDAVLFHGNQLDVWDLPAKRSMGQYYVFVNLESPEYRPLRIPFFEDFFNLTMTYRLDSDVMWSYGVLKDAETSEVVAPSENPDWTRIWTQGGNTTEPDLDYTVKKTKAVTWFASNCPAKSGRLEYVKELQRHIPVDIYGKCGTFHCSRDRDCMAEVVEPNYFFYLAFENSLCDDYVTEKFYNPLRYNVVPVVYGGANYTRFAPPYSHINALDFDSPADLAVHLKSLMKNPVEYRKYFRWKRHYRVDGGSGKVCRLCEFLHTENRTRIYSPLSDWFEHEKCPLQRRLGPGKFATRRTLIGPQ